MSHSLSFRGCSLSKAGYGSGFDVENKTLAWSCWTALLGFSRVGQTRASLHHGFSLVSSSDQNR